MAGVTIPGLAVKATVVGADMVEIWDSEASVPLRSKSASFTVQAEFFRTLTLILTNKTLERHSWVKGADLASANPLVIGNDGNFFDVTGVGGIASMTVPVGMPFMLQFDGVLVLTHHATNLILPGAANITTAAGDRLIGFAVAANEVLVVSYTLASGRAVVELTNAEIKTAYEANADTNEFSDAEQTKLAGIETSATADQTNAEIKTAYEANADTNEFSDAEQTKLAGIETSADVTDATNVDAADAFMNSDLSVNGLVVRTAAGAYLSRSIAVGSAKLTVSNGDGVSGNMTVDLGAVALANLSDVGSKTGSGTVVVMDTSPTIITPTIASFTNATHDHEAAAGGGALSVDMALAHGGGSVGIGTTSPGSKLEVRVDAVSNAVADTEALSIVNTTAAIANVSGDDGQQYSPALRLEGQGWKTDATAASQSVEYKLFVRPIQGAASPTGSLDLQASINGAAYTSLLSVLSNGRVGIGTTAPDNQLTVTGDADITGDVGIGTNVPSAKLHVAATSGTGGATSFGDGILVRDSNTANIAPNIRVQGQRNDGSGLRYWAGGIALEGYDTAGKVPDQKVLGWVTFGGNHTDGTEANIRYAASIVGRADGAFNSVSDMPTALEFYTGIVGTNLAENANLGTKRMTIGSNGNITLADAVDVILNATTGTKWANATNQKQAWWGATPIVQPVGAAQVAPAAYATGAFGLDTDAKMQALFDLVVAMRLALVNAGIMKGAA